MKVSMKLEGGVELAGVLNQLPAKVSRRVIRDALERAGTPMQSRMGRLAPRAPGAPDIADNIVMSPARMEGMSDNDQTAAIAIGPIKELAYYGYFQEVGTMHHGAQPFVRPAFDQEVQRVLSAIRAAFWTALTAVGVSRTVTSSASPSGGAFLAGGIGRGKPTKRRTRKSK